MKLNFNFLVNELEGNTDTFGNLLKINNPEQAIWKPSNDKWCLLEIICHLVDEETLDFRERTKSALSRGTFIPINPVGWVTSKAYIKQDYASKVAEWITERKASVKWLKSLQNPDWNKTLVHDELGEMSAGLFLENWVAHDFIHLRQVTRTKRAFLDFMTDDNLTYAGKW